MLSGVVTVESAEETYEVTICGRVRLVHLANPTHLIVRVFAAIDG